MCLIGFVDLGLWTESNSMPIVTWLSGPAGARSKRNFQRPASNCGMALNSGSRVFIVLQSRLRLQIRAPRQSTGSVPQTRKKGSNLSFQESDFSSCHFSQAFEDRHFKKFGVFLRLTWIGSRDSSDLMASVSSQNGRAPSANFAPLR